MMIGRGIINTATQPSNVLAQFTPIDLNYIEIYISGVRISNIDVNRRVVKKHTIAGANRGNPAPAEDRRILFAARAEAALVEGSVLANHLLSIFGIEDETYNDV